MSAQPHASPGIRVPAPVSTPSPPPLSSAAAAVSDTARRSRSARSAGQYDRLARSPCGPTPAVWRRLFVDYHRSSERGATRERIPVLVAIGADRRVLSGVAYVPGAGAPYSDRNAATRPGSDARNRPVGRRARDRPGARRRPASTRARRGREWRRDPDPALAPGRPELYVARLRRDVARYRGHDPGRWL